MITKVQKWGNSLGVRIPKSLAADAEICAGASVDLRIEGGRIVLVPAARKYALEELVSRITPANRHPETDWGPPVGREIW